MRVEPVRDASTRTISRAAAAGSGVWTQQPARAASNPVRASPGSARPGSRRSGRSGRARARTAWRSTTIRPVTSETGDAPVDRGADGVQRPRPDDAGRRRRACRRCRGRSAGSGSAGSARDAAALGASGASSPAARATRRPAAARPGRARPSQRQPGSASPRAADDRSRPGPRRSRAGRPRRRRGRRGSRSSSRPMTVEPVGPAVERERRLERGRDRQARDRVACGRTAGSRGRCRTGRSIDRRQEVGLEERDAVRRRRGRRRSRGPGPARRARCRSPRRHDLAGRRPRRRSVHGSAIGDRAAARPDVDDPDRRRAGGPRARRASRRMTSARAELDEPLGLRPRDERPGDRR